MAGIPLALNFDLGASLPLDSRIVVSQFTQLNSISPKYSGMQVYAADTKKLYYLEDLGSNKWTEVITSSNLPTLPTTIVYTTGDQSISGIKRFLSNTTFDKEINVFEKLSLTNKNWTLTNTFFGNVLTGQISSGQFIGNSIYLNNDGNILITNGVNAYSDSWGYGTYIFTTGINNTWRLLQEIVTTNSGYGNTFRMSRDNSILVIGKSNDFVTNNGILYRPGEVHIYTGSIENGWNKKQTLTGFLENYEEFGSSIAISDNAEVIVVGSPKYEFQGNGGIRIFTGSKNTEWKLKQFISGEAPKLSFGLSLACNHDASLLVVGGIDRTSTSGLVYTFVGSPTTNWTLQQKLSGLIQDGDYGFFGPGFGQGVDINKSGNILMVTDHAKLDGRGAIYFYTGSKNNTWVNTNQVFGLYSRSHLKNVQCNDDASVVLVGASDYPNRQGDNGYTLILQKSTDFSWFIKQQITEPSGEYDYFGESISINGKGDIFALGTRVIWGQTNGVWGPLQKGAINTYKDLRPNEFIVGNVFPESFLKIIGSTKFIGDTIISGNTKIYSNERPLINDKLIVVSGEAIMPDSDARLTQLEFKNPSEFALDGPYFRSTYQGSGNPAGLNLWGSEGRIVRFTETGVNFFERPTVNGTGVLLQGETVENNLMDPFNGNRAITINVQGFKDINVGGNTISGFLNNLFFPYIQSTISLNSFNIYTYGIDSLSTINFISTITSNNDLVTGIAAFRGLARLTNTEAISVNGTQNVTQNVPIVINSTTLNYLSRVYINRSGLSTNIASNNQSIRFEPTYYFGLSSNTDLTAAQITGLSNVIGPNNNSAFYNGYALNGNPANLSTTFTNPTNQYLYIAYPGQEVPTDYIKDWGAITSITDTITFQQYTNEFEARANVSIPFAYKTLQYRVYRSKLPWNITAQFNLRFNLI